MRILELIGILLWGLALYVCAFDWADVRDRYERERERRERDETVRRMWQRDGRAGPDGKTGHICPEKMRKRHTQE